MPSSYSFVRLAVAIVPLVTACEALAQVAPSALRGKSIVVSWTENRMQRFEGGGQFRQQSVPNTLQVYVSAEGRTFERRSVPGGKREGVGGGSITNRAGGSRFQGSTLVVAGATRGGGARMVMITFDSAFSSCNAKVQVGHEGGSDVVKGTSLRTGQPIEFTMLGVTGESCSIQSGNVFAQ